MFDVPDNVSPNNLAVGAKGGTHADKACFVVDDVVLKRILDASTD